MATQTSKLKLHKADYSDVADIANINLNMDKIDKAFADNEVAVNGKAPSNHTHTKANITDFAHTHTKANITDFAHEHTINEINGFNHTHPKEDITNFAHTHTKANITDFSHTHTKNDIADFAHTHARSSITDFEHTHAMKDITGLSLEWSAINNKPISSSVNSSSTTDIANSYAVKQCMDKGNSALNQANTATTKADNAMTKANEAFQFASNGKAVVASAITGEGIPATSSETFDSLSKKIPLIRKGYKRQSDGKIISDIPLDGELIIKLPIGFAPSKLFLTLDVHVEHPISGATLLLNNVSISNIVTPTLLQGWGSVHNEKDRFGISIDITKVSSDEVSLIATNAGSCKMIKCQITKWCAFE